ncbi:MAG: class I SAM-dependent methyltransferase [Candidatus Thorarchaeota archaeon]|nr:class I SAM-dependent methyltransferase [Candidatus Thorarchaeota archaeon]
MPDWEKIFKEKGYVFVDPHPDISRLAKLFQDNSVKNILDLGCGTGRHLVYLSRDGFEVSGFDSSKTALELTEKWLKEEELNADICLSRMEEPFPYPDVFFDVVISIQVIHHNLMQDILTTIREVERVLKIGGYLFITVPILGPKPENPEDDWKLHQVEDGTFIPQSGPESGIPHHYFTEEELYEVFRNFDILEMYIDDTNHRCVLAIREF